ncbi:MAG: hypothetical protein ABIM89_02755 [Mycobacteriales bacterium]
MREEIGAVASFKGATSSPVCRRPALGKILRRSMRAIADGRDEPLASTIEDVGVLDALRPLLREG